MADVPVFPIDEAKLRRFEEHVAQEDGWEYEWLAESVPSFCAALRAAWKERDEAHAEVADLEGVLSERQGDYDAAARRVREMRAALGVALRGWMHFPCHEIPGMQRDRDICQEIYDRMIEETPP